MLDGPRLADGPQDQHGTAERAAKTKDPKKRRALWESLLKKYGDTCLAARIREHLPK